jgi:hypothetical protein
MGSQIGGYAVQYLYVVCRKDASGYEGRGFVPNWQMPKACAVYEWIPGGVPA